jgi:hypothetical protein
MRKMVTRLKHMVSMLVLVVFSLYLVPHEAVHVFYDHDDTEHHEEHNSSASFSTVHIHCDFLATDLTDFLPAEEHNPILCSVELPCHYNETDVQNVRCVSVLRESRGPPLS